VQTFKIAATIAVALVLQLLLGKYAPFMRYVDLPLVVTAYFSLQRVPMLAMTVGIVMGLAGDKVFGSVLGVGGFSKTLIGYVIAVGSIKFPLLENFLVRLGVIAFASAANTLLFIGLYQMLEQPLPFPFNWSILAETGGWKALGDTSAGLVVFMILDRLFPEQGTSGRVATKRRFS
jgi:rod shape-determining protein MreD